MRRFAMKRKGLITFIAIYMGIFLLVGVTFAAEEKKAEIKVVSKVVTIHPSEGLVPPTVTADLGTTVVWLNRDRSPVEILFTDKKVTIACGSPVNFIIGKGGAYESAKIPFGGTASLCFLNNGSFDYVVKSSRTFYTGTIERDHKGTITIR
jgi:plastocyanin